MTKADLIGYLSEDLKITAKLAGDMLDAVAAAATEQLVTGREFTLPGIGKLKPKTRAAGTTRNPKTGEKVDIAARTVVKFSVAKALKDAVA